MMVPSLLLCLATQAPPLTLEDSVQRALGFHATVQSQRALVDDARSYDRQARTWPNPVFSAVAQDVGLAAPGPSPLVLQQSLSFPVLFMYTRQQEQRVAAAGITQARSTVEEQRRQIRLQVGRAYFDLLVQTEVVRIEEQGALLAADQLRMTAQRVEDGDASPLDVQRAQAESLEAGRVLEAAQRRRDAVALAFSVLVGEEQAVNVSVAQDWAAAERVLQRLTSLDRQDLLHAHALRARADLRLARAQLQRAEEQHALETRKVLPLADVQLSVATRQSALGTGAVVGVTAPIPAFDRNQGPRDRTRAAIHAAEATLVRAQRQALLEVDTAWLVWKRARAALQQWAVPAVEARTATLQGVEAQYAAGTVMLLDLIAARRDVLAARRALAQTRWDAAVAAWDLVSALGVE